VTCWSPVRARSCATEAHPSYGKAASRGLLFN
jgi:hypothetical protein